METLHRNDALEVQTVGPLHPTHGEGSQHGSSPHASSPLVTSHSASHAPSALGTRPPTASTVRPPVSRPSSPSAREGVATAEVGPWAEGPPESWAQASGRVAAGYSGSANKVAGEGAEAATWLRSSSSGGSLSVRGSAARTSARRRGGRGGGDEDAEGEAVFSERMEARMEGMVRAEEERAEEARKAADGTRRRADAAAAAEADAPEASEPLSRSLSRSLSGQQPGLQRLHHWEGPPSGFWAGGQLEAFDGSAEGGRPRSRGALAGPAARGSQMATPYVAREHTAMLEHLSTLAEKMKQGSAEGNEAMLEAASKAFSGPKLEEMLEVTAPRRRSQQSPLAHCSSLRTPPALLTNRHPSLTPCLPPRGAP